MDEVSGFQQRNLAAMDMSGRGGKAELRLAPRLDVVSLVMPDDVLGLTRWVGGSPMNEEHVGLV